MVQTFYKSIFTILTRSLNSYQLLEKFDDYNKKNIVFGGDFNLIFDCKFNASGGNPILKKNI